MGWLKETKNVRIRHWAKFYGLLTKNKYMKINKQQHFLCIPMTGFLAKTTYLTILSCSSKKGPKSIEGWANFDFYWSPDLKLKLVSGQVKNIQLVSIATFITTSSGIGLESRTVSTFHGPFSSTTSWSFIYWKQFEWTCCVWKFLCGWFRRLVLLWKISIMSLTFIDVQNLCDFSLT